MSWHCLPELAAGFLGEGSLDGAVCAPSKWSPTLVTCCLPASATDFLIASLFGTTCRLLTASPGAGMSMSSAADSLARTSALPVRAPEFTVSAAGCGPTWRGSLARFDPDLRSWRTAQPSLLGDLDESSVIWPRSGMTAAGQCWELPTLGRRTSATGSGLWPTPTSTLGTNGGLVTPAKAREGGTLIEALSARTTWPTPLSRDHKSGKATQATHDKNSRPLSEQVGGSLNPAWVELLMHWPAGWTSLQPMGSAEMRGWGEGWEDGIAHVAVGVPQRVQRLKAIGNGQVPVCAEQAWRLLSVP